MTKTRKESMNTKRYVLIEVSEEEEKEINEKRNEFLNKIDRLRRIPISVNEIDLEEWQNAFSVAGPHKSAIMSLFYFYEDGKEFLRSGLI